MSSTSQVRSEDEIVLDASSQSLDISKIGELTTSLGKLGFALDLPHSINIFSHVDIEFNIFKFVSINQFHP